jgi:hypothetical protein
MICPLAPAVVTATYSPNQTRSVNANHNTPNHNYL